MRSRSSSSFTSLVEGPDATMAQLLPAQSGNQSGGSNSGLGKVNLPGRTAIPLGTVLAVSAISSFPTTQSPIRSLAWLALRIVLGRDVHLTGKSHFVGQLVNAVFVVGAEIERER